MNSHLSISTKPGKNYLTLQELATGFFSPSKLSCFSKEIDTTDSHLSINTKPGENVQKFDRPGGREPGLFFPPQLKWFLFIEIATTNSRLPISSKPGKNCCPSRSYIGFFFSLQLS